MYLKENSKLTFFITHGHHNSVGGTEICKTCFRSLQPRSVAEITKNDEKSNEDTKSINIIFSDFCDETSAHGFSRCRKPQSNFKRTMWCVITAGVFVGIAIHLLFLVKNYLRYNIIWSHKSIFKYFRGNMPFYVVTDILVLEFMGCLPLGLQIHIP